MNCEAFFNIVKANAPADCATRLDEDGIHIEGPGSYDRIRIGFSGDHRHFVRNLANFKNQITKNGIEWTFRSLEQIHLTWRMATSLYAYNYQLSKTGEQVIDAESNSCHDYLSNYRIPRTVKAAILDAVRESIELVEVGVGSDPEGCSYNSIKYKGVKD